MLGPPSEGLGTEVEPWFCVKTCLSAAHLPMQLSLLGKKNGLKIGLLLGKEASRKFVFSAGMWDWNHEPREGKERCFPIKKNL